MFCVLYTSFLMINRKETSIMYTIKDFRCMQHMQNMFIYLAGDSHLNSVETILQDSSQCLSDYPRNGIHKNTSTKTRVRVLPFKTTTTPPKFNMEPENDGFQKESPFPGTSFQVLC